MNGLRLSWILAASAGLVLALVAGWMLGTGDRKDVGSDTLVRLDQLSRTQPSDATVCLPGESAREVPEFDTEYGRQFYPNRIAERRVDLPVAKTARLLHQPDLEPEEDLAILGTVISEYIRAMGAIPQGGSNEEITRRLQGRNSSGVVLISKDHPAVSEGTELLDRWGTPYFFHPESAHHLGIRSAGPDRRMWTGDDLLNEVAAEAEAVRLNEGGLSQN
jgi:hypothetical protein